jgi:hypothetical protein
MMNPHCLRLRVCRLKCQLCEQKDLLYISGLSSASAGNIKKKEPSSSSKRAVHNTNTQKTFTRHLPALCDNCVLTPALTTHVYKQCNTACPLFTAAAIRRVLYTDNPIYLLYVSPAAMGRNAQLNTYR